jgi:hypothetical protein
MPNEPLALLDILARLPDEADYDTVCATLMATERGRRFLAEYAERNRHADTRMVVDALARVEAAVRGEPSLRPTGELLEIAAAIDRIEADIASHPAFDIFAAVERIQDIAFVLHERSVEQSLCDALDDAIRKISGALARGDRTTESAGKATELLRALSTRVRAMVTRQAPAAQPPTAPGSDHENFAQAIAALATSLPALADEPEPDLGAASGPQIEAAPIEVAAPIETIISSTDGAGDSGEALSGLPPSSENVLAQAFESNPFSRTEIPDEIPVRLEEPTYETPSNEVRGEAPPPSQSNSPSAVVDPQEDPGDLFEPMPVPTPVPVAEVSQEPSAPQRIAATPPSRAVPRPAAGDPLAVVRALSEDELIALFS